jgi:hypothetical protein
VTAQIQPAVYVKVLDTERDMATEKGERRKKKKETGEVKAERKKKVRVKER